MRSFENSHFFLTCVFCEKQSWSVKLRELHSLAFFLQNSAENGGQKQRPKHWQSNFTTSPRRKKSSAPFCRAKPIVNRTQWPTKKTSSWPSCLCCDFFHINQRSHSVCLPAESLIGDIVVELLQKNCDAFRMIIVCLWESYKCILWSYQLCTIYLVSNSWPSHVSLGSSHSFVLEYTYCGIPSLKISLLDKGKLCSSQNCHSNRVWKFIYLVIKIVVRALFCATLLHHCRSKMVDWLIEEHSKARPHGLKMMWNLFLILLFVRPKRVINRCSRIFSPILGGQKVLRLAESIQSWRS